MKKIPLLAVTLGLLIVFAIPSLAQSCENANHLNVFYAHNSYKQFNQFYADGSLEKIDSMSFAWARFVDNPDASSRITTKKEAGNSFYIPQGFQDVLGKAKEKNVSRNLNFYADSNYAYIFQEEDRFIGEISQLINGSKVNGHDLSFEGVVIDFEMLPLVEKANYVDFLKKLKKELDKNDKKLFVAIAPWDSYDFKEIVKIADRMILMLHDYDPKRMDNLEQNAKNIKTPLTPYAYVKKDLEKISKEISNDGLLALNKKKNLEKISLQINFAASQWVSENNRLIHERAYTPSYEMISERIIKELQAGKDLKSILKYDEFSRNPYLLYSDGNRDNIIWYENSISIEEKINLAKEVGIGGISLWRLGNIPDTHNTINLNIWKKVLEFF